MSVFNHIGPAKKHAKAKAAPKPRGHTVFSAPLPKGKAFSHQEHKAKARVRHAEKALPKQPQRNSSLPPRQNSVTRSGNVKNSLGQIDRAEKKAESKRVHSIPGKDNQRLERAQINMESILGSLKEVGNAKHDALHPDHNGLKDFLASITGSGPRTVKGGKGVTGLPIAAADSRAASGGVPSLLNSVPSRASKAIGEEFVEHPGPVTKNTLKGLRDTAAATPAALLGFGVDTVSGTLHGDPARGVKKEGAAYAKDLQRRYGDLAAGTKEGKEKFKKRIEKEGAAAEGLDVATLVSGGGAALGRAAGKVAAGGKLGKAAERAANAEKHPRPRLIESEGGLGKEQALHPNLFKALGQRAQDTARKRVDEAGGKAHPIKAIKGEAHPRAKNLPRTLADDEVRPLFRTLGDRQVRKNVARAQSRARIGMKTEQHDEIVKGAIPELAKLNRTQRKALYYVGVGVSALDPVKAIEDLTEHKKMILKERKRENRPIKTDEIPGIDKLIEVAKKEAKLPPEKRKVFNDDLEGAITAARAREERVAARDPALETDQATLRRVSQAAESMGMKRDTPRADQIAEKAVTSADAQAQIPALERAVSGSKKDREIFQARISERAATRRRADKLVGEGPDRSAASRPFTKHEKELQDELHALETLHSTEARHPAALARMREIKDELAPKTRRTGSDLTENEAARLLEHERKVDHAERTLKTARDIAKDKDAHPDLRDEAAGDYADRVSEALSARGRMDPLYFPSREKVRIFGSDHAAGGARAVSGHKTYSGELFRRGRQDIDVQVLAEGLARSIKRRWNWNLVAKTFQDNHIEISGEGIAEALGRDAEHLDPDSLSIRDWEHVMDHLNIDPNRVAFWNPRKFYSKKDNHFDADEDDPTVAGHLDSSGGGLRVALGESMVDGKSVRLKARPEHFDDSGWQMVSKAAFKEIDSITQPGNLLARGFDIGKGKASRILLGAGNIPWLTFQVASNALLTGFAVGPKALLVAPLVSEIAGAHKWWKSLPEDQRRAVSAYIGVGPFEEDVRITRLGGAGAENDLVATWRAFKASKFFHDGLAGTGIGPGISKLNPLDALFRADNFQNNMFRKTVLYNKVKRDAYRRMGTNTSKAMRMQDEIVGLLHPGKDARATMNNLLDHEDLLEKYASSINDILGDYATYTARERNTLGRGVMFYGFLRYSLRLMLYTMPVKHPVVLSVLGQMGQLQASEVKSLVGEEVAKRMIAQGTKTSKEEGRGIVDEIGLPFGLGAMFFTSGGKLHSVDLSRANPALNQLVSIKGIQQIPGLLPPFLNNALDQFYSTDSYRDRRFLVQGETTPRKKSGDYGALDRIRIYAESQFKTFAPYRLTESWKFNNKPQGEDSMLFSPRPTKYVDEDILKSINKNAAESKKNHSILQTLLPLLPKGADSDIGNLADLTIREHDRRADMKKGKKKKKATGGSSSGGMKGLGGGSSSSGGMSGLGSGGGSSGGLSGLGN